MNGLFKTEILWGKGHLRQGDEFCAFEEASEGFEVSEPSRHGCCGVLEKSERYGLHFRERGKKDVARNLTM